MAKGKEVISTAIWWLKEIGNLGLGIVMIFLLVELFFGKTTGIVANVSAFVSGFTGKGLVGFVAFVIFVSVYSK